MEYFWWLRWEPGSVISARWDGRSGRVDAPQLKIGKNPIHHQYCQYYLNYLPVKNEKEINLYWFGCSWNPLMVFCIDMCLNKKNKYTTSQAGYQRSSVFRFIAPNSINRYHWNSEIWSEKISIKWFNKCHNVSTALSYLNNRQILK